jgi:hypothetical protein
LARGFGREEFLEGIEVGHMTDLAHMTKESDSVMTF